MVEIDINIGGDDDSVKIVTLRGTKSGHFELCTTIDMKRDEEIVPTLVPYNFFSTLEATFDQILKLRICSSDARTLKELKEVIGRERKALFGMFEGFVSETAELEQMHSEKKKSKTSRRPNRPNRTRKEEAPDTDMEEEEETPVRSNINRRSNRKRKSSRRS